MATHAPQTSPTESASNFGSSLPGDGGARKFIQVGYVLDCAQGREVLGATAINALDAGVVLQSAAAMKRFTQQLQKAESEKRLIFLNTSSSQQLANSRDVWT